MEGAALGRTENFFDDIYKRNVDMVYRLCYVYLKIPLMQRMLFSPYF